MTKLASLGVLCLVLSSAKANEVSVADWAQLKTAIYQTRPILSGDQNVHLIAPYRADDQRTVPISTNINLLNGASIKTVTFIVDQDPAPVAAVFHVHQPRTRMALTVNLRLNGPSFVRVVVEDSDGKLFMSAANVKVSGLGACAAPPATDQATASRTLGQMKLANLRKLNPTAHASATNVSARLQISHPNNSGLQMNQITMLYVPAKFITHIAVTRDNRSILDVDGSISLSENPALEFDYVPGGEGVFHVQANASDGAIFKHEFNLTPNS